MDGGKFAKLVRDGDCSKNMQKHKAWTKFAAAFNHATGSSYSKRQLQDNYATERKKASSSHKNKDDLDLSRFRKDCAVTVGGPPTSVSLSGTRYRYIV